MIEAYLPALLLTVVASGLAILLFTVASLMGPKAMTPTKAIPYESGSETDGANHIKLSVKFYLTAILFVVFDIEVVFLFPWASIFRELGWFGLFEMMAFIVTLSITLFYCWKKGALQWEK